MRSLNKIAELLIPTPLVLTRCGTADDPSSSVPAGYQLVWYDEFEVDGLPDWCS